MPSSTSNFKRILRLPRLFFRKPTASESVHGGPPLEFERPIPPIAWRGITVVVVLLVGVAALEDARVADGLFAPVLRGARNRPALDSRATYLRHALPRAEDEDDRLRYLLGGVGLALALPRVLGGLLLFLLLFVLRGRRRLCGRGGDGERREQRRHEKAS